METEDRIYLVEVKGEDKLDDPDVIAKKKRGIQYCGVASRWLQGQRLQGMAICVYPV